MRKLGFFAWALLIAACGGSEPVQTIDPTAAGKTAKGLAALLPAEADVVVRVESLQSLEQLLQEIATVAEQRAPAGATAMIGAQAGVDLQQVDWSQPLAIALTFDPQSPMPAITSVMAVKDAGKVQNVVARSGDYVAVSRGSAYQGGSRLAAEMPAGDLVVRVNLQSLVRKYRQQVDGLLAMAQQRQGLPLPVSVSALMGDVFSNLRVIVDSAETVDFSVRSEAGRLSCDVAYVARHGSPLAATEVAPSRLGALTATLPRAFPLMIAAHFDLAAQLEAWRPVVVEMAAKADGDAKPVLERFDAFLQQSQALGDEWVFGIDVDGDGLEAVGSARAKDAAKFVADYAGAAKGFSAPGVKVSTAQRDLDGTAVHRLQFQLDPSLTDEKAMKALFGGDTIAVELAASGDRVVCSVGGDIGTALQAGSDAFAKAAGQIPGEARFLLRVDVRTFIAGVTAAAKASGERPPNALSPSAPDVVTVFGSRDGRTYRAGLRLDLPQNKQAAVAGDD